MAASVRNRGPKQNEVIKQFMRQCDSWQFWKTLTKNSEFLLNKLISCFQLAEYAADTLLQDRDYNSDTRQVFFMLKGEVQVLYEEYSSGEYDDVHSFSSSSSSSSSQGNHGNHNLQRDFHSSRDQETTENRNNEFSKSAKMLCALRARQMDSSEDVSECEEEEYDQVEVELTNYQLPLQAKQSSMYGVRSTKKKQGSSSRANRHKNNKWMTHSDTLSSDITLLKANKSIDFSCFSSTDLNFVESRLPRNASRVLFLQKSLLYKRAQPRCNNKRKLSMPIPLNRWRNQLKLQTVFHCGQTMNGRLLSTDWDNNQCAGLTLKSISSVSFLYMQQEQIDDFLSCKAEFLLKYEEFIEDVFTGNSINPPLTQQQMKGIKQRFLLFDNTKPTDIILQSTKEDSAEKGIFLVKEGLFELLLPTSNTSVKEQLQKQLMIHQSQQRTCDVKKHTKTATTFPSQLIQTLALKKSESQNYSVFAMLQKGQFFNEKKLCTNTLNYPEYAARQKSPYCEIIQFSVDKHSAEQFFPPSVLLMLASHAQEKCRAIEEEKRNNPSIINYLNTSIQIPTAMNTANEKIKLNSISRYDKPEMIDAVVEANSEIKYLTLSISSLNLNKTKNISLNDQNQSLSMVSECKQITAPSQSPQRPFSAQICPSFLKPNILFVKRNTASTTTTAAANQTQTKGSPNKLNNSSSAAVLTTPSPLYAMNNNEANQKKKSSQLKNPSHQLQIQHQGNMLNSSQSSRPVRTVKILFHSDRTNEASPQQLSRNSYQSKGFPPTKHAKSAHIENLLLRLSQSKDGLEKQPAAATSSRTPSSSRSSKGKTSNSNATTAAAVAARNSPLIRGNFRSLHTSNMITSSTPDRPLSSQHRDTAISQSQQQIDSHCSIPKQSDSPLPSASAMIQSNLRGSKIRRTTPKQKEKIHLSQQQSALIKLMHEVEHQKWLKQQSQSVSTAVMPSQVIERQTIQNQEVKRLTTEQKEKTTASASSPASQFTKFILKISRDSHRMKEFDFPRATISRSLGSCFSPDNSSSSSSQENKLNNPSESTAATSCISSISDSCASLVRKVPIPSGHLSTAMSRTQLSMSVQKKPTESPRKVNSAGVISRMSESITSSSKKFSSPPPSPQYQQPQAIVSSINLHQNSLRVNDSPVIPRQTKPVLKSSNLPPPSILATVNRKQLLSVKKEVSPIIQQKRKTSVDKHHTGSQNKKKDRSTRIAVQSANEFTDSRSTSQLSETRIISKYLDNMELEPIFEKNRAHSSGKTSRNNQNSEAFADTDNKETRQQQVMLKNKIKAVTIKQIYQSTSQQQLQSKKNHGDNRQQNPKSASKIRSLSRK